MISPIRADNLKIDLNQVGTLAWVENLLQTYPELAWLLDEKVAITQEGKQQAKSSSWSYQLKGQQFPEFDRTILSIVNLYLLTEGSRAAYQRFASIQKEDERLSWNEFQSLHHFAQEVIKDNPARFHALMVNLLMGDMGKTAGARELAKTFAITEPDHDLFLEACLVKCSQIFPTFQKLPFLDQQLIKEIVGLVHFGHVTHLEGSPKAMLAKIKQSDVLAKQGRPFDFQILMHFCDVAAALGHVDNQGSLILVHDTYRALMAVKTMLDELSKQSETSAVKKYLSLRAQWVGLPLKRDRDYLLTRLACMVRLFDANSGQLLIASWNKLTQQQKQLLIENFHPLKEFSGMTPTYVPAVFVNIYKNEPNKAQAIGIIMTKALPFVTKVMSDFRHNQTSVKFDPTLTINFNKVAGQVRDNVSILDNADYIIHEDGLVEIVPHKGLTK